MKNDHERLLRVLRRRKVKPWTVAELADRLGWKKGKVNRRCAELRRAGAARSELARGTRGNGNVGHWWAAA